MAIDGEAAPAGTSPEPPAIVGANAGINGWKHLIAENVGEEYAIHESVAPTALWGDMALPIQCVGATRALGGIENFDLVRRTDFDAGSVVIEIYNARYLRGCVKKYAG